MITLKNRLEYSEKRAGTWLESRYSFWVLTFFFFFGLAAKILKHYLTSHKRSTHRPTSRSRCSFCSVLLTKEDPGACARTPQAKIENKFWIPCRHFKDVGNGYVERSGRTHHTSWAVTHSIIDMELWCMDQWQIAQSKSQLSSRKAIMTSKWNSILLTVCKAGRWATEETRLVLPKKCLEVTKPKVRNPLILLKSKKTFLSKSSNRTLL